MAKRVQLEARQAATLRRLGLTLPILVDLLVQLKEDLMSWKEELKAAIEEDTSVTQSAVALLSKMADQLQQMVNDGVDEDELQKYIDEVRANTTTLADAVKANTPAPPEPPAEPVEPEVEPE